MMSNCIARMQNSMNVMVGDEVDAFNNHSLLTYTRPFDRGYLVNWQIEIDIWNRIFDANHLNISPKEHCLVVTEPSLNPLECQNEMNEVIFEDYRFESCCRRPAAAFLEYHHFRQQQQQQRRNDHGCMLVVDSGFSSTHIVPFINHRAMKNAIVRVDVGGKLITNYLKETISFRQVNVMDEFKLINQLKEEMCAVTEKNASTNHHRNISTGPRVFVLPDFQKTFNGMVIDRELVGNNSDQFLTMGSECNSVPEILFSPNDIQMNQKGLIEAASSCINSFPKEEASLISENVLLTGGNIQFLNFRRRFQSELRKNMESLDFINASFIHNDSIMAPWKGASTFAEHAMNNVDFHSKHFINRSEYEEYGHYYCNNKFRQNW